MQQENLPLLSGRTPPAATPWTCTETTRGAIHTTTPICGTGGIAFCGTHMGVCGDEFLKVPAPAIATPHQTGLAGGNQNFGRLAAVPTFELINRHISLLLLTSALPHSTHLTGEAFHPHKPRQPGELSRSHYSPPQPLPPGGS